MKVFDPSLYLVVGGDFCRGGDVLGAVARAVAGGVSLVQLREKKLGREDRIALARRLVEILKPLKVPLVLNDCVETALAAGAQGVHLGQSDGSPVEARARLGPDAIVGISLESTTPLDGIAWPVLDYVAASPVFATPTKPDTCPPFGLEGLRTLRARVALPLVAIGGIHLENVAEVFAAGANGVAVVSSILGSSDETEAARALRRAMRRKNHA